MQATKTPADVDVALAMTCLTAMFDVSNHATNIMNDVAERS